MFLMRSKPQPVQVSTRHIPVVEVLWQRLVEAKQQVAAKEDYLQAARGLDVRVASLASLADTTEAGAKAIRRATKDLDRIKRLLALGAEPTTPPQHWYCGRLTEPPRDENDRSPRETWPTAQYDRRSMVFAGALPVEALRRYAVTKELLDDARVYSPRQEDFYRLPEPEVHDPVLIGMVAFFGDPQYFEIARWDIDRDLAVIFGKVGR